MTIEEKIAVMTAYENGKLIEIKGGIYTEWQHVNNPTFDFINFEYRVFKWNAKAKESMLGKTIRHGGHIKLIVAITHDYMCTSLDSFSFDSPMPDLDIKSDGKWVPFKDYKPE